jgi:DNA polymerase-1
MSLQWDCIYLDTIEGVKLLLEDLMESEVAAFDTEISDPVTGFPTICPDNCEIILSSFTFSPERAFVVKGDLIRYLSPWFASNDHKKIGHNLLFDAKVILKNKHFPMDFQGYYADTLYLAWLEDCEQDQKKGSLGLKHQLASKFGIKTTDFADVWFYRLPDRKTPVKLPMWDVLEKPDSPGFNRSDAIHYAGLDAWGTFHLYQSLKERLKNRGYWSTYLKVDRPFLWLLWDELEETGIRLDMDFLEKTNKEMEVSILRNQHLWDSDISPDVMMTSNKQLAHLFFRHGLNEATGVDKSCGCSKPHVPFKLGKPDPKQGWNEGVPSVNTEVLRKLSEENCRAAEIIVQGKQNQTLKRNFIDRYLGSGEPEFCNDEPIFVAHTSWNPILRTGRISGRKNSRGLCGTLQNVPRDATKDPYRVRKAFVARPGHALLVADYSQLELRILAHFSCDANLLTAFQEGFDLHSFTAKKAFNLPCAVEDVKKLHNDKRSTAKILNFGIPYGTSWHRVSKTIGCSEENAKLFIANWFEAYPDVKNYMDSQIAFAKTYGYVLTLSGRRRYLPEIKLPIPKVHYDKATDSQRKVFKAVSHAKRVSYNTPIQGSAGDLIKKAQVDIYQNADLRRMGFKQLLQIHDELVAEAPIRHAEECKTLMCELMVNAYSDVLNVPLEVDGDIAFTWEDAK